MNSETKPLTAKKWLKGRGRRRIEAVDQAYGVLGLDYGKGHLDNLYETAYNHAFRDVWAHAERVMHARFTATLPGTQEAGYVVLHNQAQESP